MPYVETFDGLELAPAPSEVPCAACGAAISFDLWRFVGRARSGWALSDAEAASWRLARSTERGMVITRVLEGGPSAYVGELSCPTCGADTPVVVGLDEFQPGRWIGGVVRQ